ncbi:hypothetical protein [Nocardia terpenica]|uniref:hypothetical protein n=1 Tax=Nocardia terpenica TaxID=455432 RepID=UPI0002F8A548|nr:hypothetical protein [Nocardia terpenica]NQE88713.1 hypothetical protein [Nocardia terpenica]
MRTVLRVFTSNDTWHKPAGLESIELIVRAGGGGGNTTSGGGGGAAVHLGRIRAADLPDSAVVIVGAAGGLGADGGVSAFGNLVAAQPGRGGDSGGAGGLAVMRGGIGGAEGQPGESVSSGVVALLAGGGGGAGAGSVGGASGLVPAGVSRPPLWQSGQSGSGGNPGQPGGYPAGGGGAGAAGAAGVVTVIEYHYYPPAQPPAAPGPSMPPDAAKTPPDVVGSHGRVHRGNVVALVPGNALPRDPASDRYGSDLFGIA